MWTKKSPLMSRPGIKRLYESGKAMLAVMTRTPTFQWFTKMEAYFSLMSQSSLGQAALPAAVLQADTQRWRLLCVAFPSRVIYFQLV